MGWVCLTGTAQLLKPEVRLDATPFFPIYMDFCVVFSFLFLTLFYVGVLVDLQCCASFRCTAK